MMLLLLEVYAFMESDLGLLRPGGNPDDATAVEAMADLADSPQAIREIASALGMMFRNKSDRGITIRSFATFIPELAHGADHDKSKRRAVNALRFLCQLCVQLRLPDNGSHMAEYIEIVGGSIHDGVMPVRFDGHRGLLCVRKPKTTLFDSLLGSLSDLLPTLVHTGVRIAIEAEPGPLFSCGSSSDVAILAGGIANRCMTDWIGLNYDMGHYFIMGWRRSGGCCALVPELCPHENPCLTSEANGGIVRVFGIHVTDHASAHVADCFPGTFHSAADFRDPLNRLTRFGKLSGKTVVTIEQECCASRAILLRAIEETRRL